MPGWILPLVVSHLICYGLPNLVWQSSSLILDQHLALWPYQVLQVNSIVADEHPPRCSHQIQQSAFDRYPLQQHALTHER